MTEEEEENELERSLEPLNIDTPPNSGVNPTNTTNNNNNNNNNNKIKNKTKTKTKTNNMNDDDSPLPGHERIDSNSSLALHINPYKPFRYDSFLQFVRIVGPSLAFFGCQFAWAVEDGNVSPYLRELGLSDDAISYAWIAGPITGIIFQPIIGVYSDHCKSRLGRRRPFIIFGCIALSICLIIFPISKYIGEIFGDYTHHRYVALSIAIITFWLLDFSTNLLEGPLRAMTSDTLTSEEQLISNSWFGTMNGIASTIGFALGYVYSIQATFIVASLIVLLTCVLTSVAVKEKPLSLSEQTRLQLENENNCQTAWRRIIEIFTSFRDMPGPILSAWIVQFCTYFAHFCMWVYLSDYFGEDILGGDPDASESSDDYKLYEKGVSYGNLAFCLISAVSAIFSFIAPHIVNLIGLKLTWAICLMIYAFVLLISPMLNSVWIAIILFSFVGFPMGASFTLPWSVVAEYSALHGSDRHGGLWATSMNMAECFPELCIGLLGGSITDYFDGNISSVLFLGGIIVLIGAFMTTHVQLPNQDARPLKSNQHGYEKVANNENNDDAHELLPDEPNVSQV